MKKINFKKLFSIKNTVFSLFLLAAVFLFGSTASAGIGEALGNVVGGVIMLLINAVVQILILLVNLLMVIAAYSDFIHAPAVEKGWIVVRDLCNMFFVVILLIIAFATILGQEEYGAKKMLPKLIMAAVLINFSKLICGLMIDVSNVVMLTFVNAFSAIGAGNMIEMLGIANVVKIASTSIETVTFGAVVASYIFGLIYVVIATIVVAAMVAMLVVRLVMIWILVVLSPFAFFLQAVPGKGKQYSEKWWGMWTENLLVGPIIAFFLWLSFAALQGGSPIVAPSSTADLASVAGPGTEAGTVAQMSKFVIAIGMLLGGMKIAKDVGGEAAGAMGKVFNKGQGLATAAAGAAGGFALARGKALANATGRGARNVALGAVGSMGKVDPITGKRSSAVGNLALQWRDDLQAARKKEKVAGREKFLKKIGFGEKTAESAKVIYDDIKGNAKVQGFNAITKFKASNNKYNKAKADKVDYETNYQSADETEMQNLRAKIAADPTYTEANWTANEKLATTRFRKYNKDKKIVENRDGSPIASVTGKALTNMTEKKKKAESQVKVMANDTEHFSDLGKGGIYNKNGINDSQKRYLDIMNNSDSSNPTSDGYKALQNAIHQVDGTAGVKQLNNDEAHDMAKLLAAYKKGGGTMKGLNDLDNALKAATGVSAGAKSTNSDTLGDKVLVNYRDFDEKKMALKGKGQMEYNSFAQNSLKGASERDISKDYVGASFSKINDRAKDLGVDLQLETAPGATIDKSQIAKISTVMASLIDDEIKALESSANSEVANNSTIKASQNKIKQLQKDLGGIKDPNSIEGINKSNQIRAAINNEQQTINKETAGLDSVKKVNQLKAAKDRFDKKDLSTLSLNNTDVSYRKRSTSDQRREKYNTTQHENMHKAGAKNEELTHESADALQDARLIGRIPGTNKRYDTELGSMIGQMEAIKIDPAAIKQAVAEKISGWQVSSAKRTMEIEQGARQTVSESVAESSSSSTSVKEPADHTEHLANLSKTINNLNKTVDKLSSSVGKMSNGASNSNDNKASMSVSDANFFRRMFNNLNKKIEKIPVTNVKPITAMMIDEESDK